MYRVEFIVDMVTEQSMFCRWMLFWLMDPWCMFILASKVLLNSNFDNVDFF